MGATATGKSALAQHLAGIFGTEIVSADARQCYKGMEIGTSAPSIKVQNAVGYHFIGTHDPEQRLSAGLYASTCKALLSRLFRKKKLLILEGGAGLYVRALCDGLVPLEKVPPNVRKKWRNLNESAKLSTLQTFVSTNDPHYYAQMDTRNMRRLARAAEIMEHTGKPYSAELKTADLPAKNDFHVHKIALLVPRKVLYERIEARCDNMLETGLWKEAYGLYTKYGAAGLPPTIGYRELFDHFEGKYGRATAEQRFKEHSRQYAKRQLTWLRKERDLLWFKTSAHDAVAAHVERLLAA